MGCAIVTSNPSLILSLYKEGRVQRIEELKSQIEALKPKQRKNSKPQLPDITFSDALSTILGVPAESAPEPTAYKPRENQHKIEMQPKPPGPLTWRAIHMAIRQDKIMPRVVAKWTYKS